MTTKAAESFDWQFAVDGDAEREKLLNAAIRFTSAMQLNEDRHWLTLLGASGIGKTHLAKRILAFWREKAGWWDLTAPGGKVPQLKESRFISWVAFMDRRKSGDYDELNRIAALPFLVIDDIGADRDTSGFSRATIDRLANERLGKWTVFTSNLFKRQIAETIDVRLTSRMIRNDNVVIESNARDYNTKKKV